MGCKFEALFGDMIRDWPRVKQNDKVYGWEVYTRVACKRSKKILHENQGNLPICGQMTLITHLG